MTQLVGHDEALENVMLIWRSTCGLIPSASIQIDLDPSAAVAD